MKPGRDTRGFTLVEVVLAIVVIAAGLTGLFVVMTETTAKSSDPMIVTQAHAVAEAYLEEILLRAYNDPSPLGSEAGETRATFDDVDDYDGLVANGCLTTTPACPSLGSCACDQFGNPLAALSGYTVNVSVATTTLNGAAAKLATVTVGYAADPKLSASLSGYRVEY